jgi:hypothetical protein
MQISCVICYCVDCDDKVESALSPSLSEYCDCDQYTRWICLSCNAEEIQCNIDYFATRTKDDYDWEGNLEEGMWLPDHTDSRAVSKLILLYNIQ